jgi:multiple sugar transport system ATP-binding protein
MNLVGADMSREDSAIVATFGEHRLRLERPELAAHDGRRLILGIRPEDLEDAALAPGGDTIEAAVDIREDLGSEVFVHFAVGGPPVRGEDVQAAVGEEAIEATAASARAKGSLWVARVGRESRAHEGEKLRLAVDVSRLQFFDPDSGDAIR